MKIKETIERECCQNQDFKKYRGDQASDSHYLGLRFWPKRGWTNALKGNSWLFSAAAWTDMHKRGWHDGKVSAPYRDLLDDHSLARWSEPESSPVRRE